MTAPIPFDPRRFRSAAPHYLERLRDRVAAIVAECAVDGMVTEVQESMALIARRIPLRT